MIVLETYSGYEVGPFGTWIPDGFGKQRKRKTIGDPDCLACFQADVAYGEAV